MSNDLLCGFLDICHKLPAKLVDKIPNMNLRKAVKAGRFDGCIIAEHIEHRIRENIRSCRVLGQSAPHTQLHGRLVACSRHRPSGLTFEPLSRQGRIEQDVALLSRLYDGVAQKNLYMVTVIVSIHSGAPERMIKEISAQMAAIRRKLRNHRADHATRHPWYKTISMFGYFEIEPYLYCSRDNKSAGGLTRAEMKQLSPEKYALLRSIGWDPNRDENFYVLHLHCIANLRSRKAFRRRLRKDGMFRFKRQVLVKRFRKNQPKDENIRRICAYMLKVAPRAGRLFKRRGKAMLPAEPMLHFLDLHSRLTFKQLSFRLGPIL